MEEGLDRDRCPSLTEEPYCRCAKVDGYYAPSEFQREAHCLSAAHRLCPHMMRAVVRKSLRSPERITA